jgi:hypothetical protein
MIFPTVFKNFVLTLFWEEMAGCKLPGDMGFKKYDEHFISYFINSFRLVLLKKIN